MPGAPLNTLTLPPAETAERFLMPDPSAERTEPITRFILANAVRENHSGTFRLAFPDRHSTLIEAWFSD